jgi:hypothetical protein
VSHEAQHPYTGRPTRPWCLDDELDVRWYLTAAPALACGLRSNLGPQLEARRLGLARVEAVHVDPDAEMVDRLDHAARARRVHRCLAAIGQEHTATLAAVYAGEVAPRELRERHGDELGALVYLMRPEVRAEAWRASHELLQAAGVRLAEAKEAYAIARAGRA